MLNTLKKRIKNEKGLSLVELLAVIVILAIVAAIAIPAIGNIIANSQAKSEIADAIQILNAGKLYELDGNEITADAPFDEENDSLGNYVEVSDRITAFEVSKNEDDAYQISFTGEQLGEVGPLTLDQLTSAEVSGGVLVEED